MTAENPDFEALRRHFRRETSKLDNWIYHRRIDEYFREDGEDAEKEKTD